jgi:hypothetical protein
MRILSELQLSKRGDWWCGRDDSADRNGVASFARVTRVDGSFVVDVPAERLNLRVLHDLDRNGPSSPSRVIGMGGEVTISLPALLLGDVPNA